jgi:LacI family transcriptional regulator
MMQTRRLVQEFRLVPPVGIVPRRSTDVMHQNDPVVARALCYIHDQAPLPMTAETVADHVGLSRGMLDLRFRRVLGRTVHDEIHRVRLGMAQKLLTATDLPLKAVAHRAGYRTPEYMNLVFRQAVGQTPGQFRQCSRGTADTASPGR